MNSDNMDNDNDSFASATSHGDELEEKDNGTEKHNHTNTLSNIDKEFNVSGPIGATNQQVQPNMSDDTSNITKQTEMTQLTTEKINIGDDKEIEGTISILRPSKYSNELNLPKKSDNFIIDNGYRHSHATIEAGDAPPRKSDSKMSYNRSFGAGKGNRPHDLLEYPPLYFLLKRFPSLLEKLRSVYNVRWSMTYPLQRRFPLARYTRKIGLVLSYGEVLLVIPFFAFAIMGLVTSFGRSSVSQSGEYARLPLIFAFLTATHNSLLTFLLGIPFERAIWYHKLSGRLALLNGLWHTYVAFVPPEDDVLSDHSWTGENTNFGKFLFDGSVNSAGTLILFLCLSMSLWSIPYIRRVFFEVFYYTHIIFAITMSGCAFYHSGVLIPILVGLLWGGDMVMRKLLMVWFCYPHKAEVKNLTRNVVEISFPKTTGFNYNPGQYMFLCIPKISYFQWHPFSISSSPHQDEVTFHIRTVGAWTKELHKYAESNDSLTILMEGPYGSLSVDLISERYKLVMLLSGGIGVTPMQSICHQLMYEYEIGAREMEKIWFLWTARDPEILDNMDVSVHGSSRYSRSMNTSMNRSQNRSMNGSRAENSSMKGGKETYSSTLQPEILEKMAEGRTALTDYAHAKPQAPQRKQGRRISAQLAKHLLTDMPPSFITDRELEEENPLDIFLDPEEDEFHDASESEENDRHRRGSTVIAQVFDILPKPSSLRTNNPQTGESATLSSETIRNTRDRFSFLSKSIRHMTTNEDNETKDNDNDDTSRPTLEVTKALHFSSSTRLIEDDNENLPPTTNNDCNDKNEQEQSQAHNGNEDDEDDTDEVLSLELFLTKKEQPRKKSVLNPFVKQGRPDLMDKFIKMREDAIARGEKRIAVCVCAPQRLVDICKNACAKYSNKHVIFDFHCETFE